MGTQSSLDGVARPSKEFGKYRLIAKIGHGGMAEVYLAAREGMGGFTKLAVIKVLHRHLREDPVLIGMFQDEARLAARLNHPHVVQTYEIGEVDGHHFMAMEHLEGQSFLRLLRTVQQKKATWKISIMLKIFNDVLSGLHYAHTLKDFDGTPLNVIHRDISPGNLFVTYEGQVKVLDFGIAKAGTQLNETKAGQVKGKFAYIAPETAKPGKRDHRADLWSLGVVMWEAFAGRRLFKGDSEVATLQAALSSDIPKLDSVVKVPTELSAIVDRALQRDVNKRYGSALAMQKDLKKLMTSQNKSVDQGEIGAFVASLFVEDRKEEKDLINAFVTGQDIPSGQHKMAKSSFNEPEGEMTDKIDESTNAVDRPADKTGVRATTTQGDETVKTELPRRLGRYLLFDHIGKGGMANIYLASITNDLGSSRRVVVKEILPTLASDPAFAAMLTEEAKLAARLSHANIVQVFDLSREEGHLFIGMEYVEGFDLNTLLRRLSKARIPLPFEFALLMIREVLRGLDYAHRAQDEDGRALGLVHRDVSPSNVLISFEGETKLCDFGIARAFAVGREAADANVVQQTRVAGKSAYMSPEHANGKQLDGRADVFAAGILLWELVAGRRMYRGTEDEMLWQAKQATVPDLPLRGLPNERRLRAIVDKSLSADLVMRYNTAEEMLIDLEEYAIENELMASSIRFGEFLTNNFAREVVSERRDREGAAHDSEAPKKPPRRQRISTAVAQTTESLEAEASKGASSQDELPVLGSASESPDIEIAVDTPETVVYKAEKASSIPPKTIALAIGTIVVGLMLAYFIINA